MGTSRFILASNSPRRRALFARIIPARFFTAIASRIKEKRHPGEVPEKYAVRMAEKKAKAVVSQHGVQVRKCTAIIAADTIVVLRRRILRQPKNRGDARKMLRMLSGKKHEVITGVYLLFFPGGENEQFVVKSKVWFKNLSTHFINEYVKTDEPLDKAGAYAIQGRGRKLIRKYQGSYTNIVGMPVKEIRDFLKGPH